MARTLAEIKREYEVSILDGMARTLWVMAYADFADANGYCANCGERIVRDSHGNFEWATAETLEDQCPDDDEGHYRDQEIWPVAGPGEDWDDKAPSTPAVAYTCANAIIAEFVRRESSPLADIFEIAATIHLGEWEWYEEDVIGKDKPSEKKREERGAKHELAVAFGSGLAHEALGSGSAWGDSHKTRRGNVEIEFDLPRTEFRVDDFDLVTWSIEVPASAKEVVQTHGSDSVTPNISIGTAVPQPNQRYYGDEEIEIVDENLRAGETRGEWIADMLKAQVRPDTLEPSSETYVDGVFYRGKPRAGAAGPAQHTFQQTIELVLNGVFPYDREWTYYFVTKSIGRIHVVDEPSNGSGRADENHLLWFGQANPLLLLVFGGEDTQMAIDIAVDYLQDDDGNSHHFEDEIVNERYRELLDEYAQEQGLPDRNMIGDRMESVLREEAEAGTFRAGNNGRYLRSEEVGLYGKDLSLEELRRIGNDGAQLQAGYHHNPASSKITVTPIPFATRSTSAASRSRQ